MTKESKNKIIHQVMETDTPHFSEKTDGDAILTISISGCCECMDEYSEAVAVSFTEWIRENTTPFTDGSDKMYFHHDTRNNLTVKELFTIYKSQNQ